MKRLTFALFAGLTASSALAATISQVTAQQRWPWSRDIDVTFALTDAPSAISVDIAVTAEGKTRFVSPAAVTGGRLSELTTGEIHVSFDPAALGFKDLTLSTDVRVAVRQMHAYMVVDLTNGAVTYRDTVDTDGTKIGDYFLWKDEYKTSKLVLRRCDGGTFRSGSPETESFRQTSLDTTRERQRTVTISQPYYLAVFETTQKQLEYALGSRQALLQYTYFTNDTCYAMRPVDYVTYRNLRGASKGAAAETTDEVDDDSIVGKFRALTNGRVRFDLPTEVEWEFAYRCGTTSAIYYNSENPTQAYRYRQIAGVIGVYGRNTTDRNSDLAAGTDAVGTKRANSWEFYDLQGNVKEICRDWWLLPVTDSHLTETDPMPLKSESYNKSYKSLRGILDFRTTGDDTLAANMRAGTRSGLSETAHDPGVGFRLYAPVQDSAE